MTVIAPFFQEADRVKFARYPATPKDGEAALQQAFEIVHRVHDRVTASLGLAEADAADGSEVAS